VVAAEDKNFWHEGGISPSGILRAAYYELTSSGGNPQAGSCVMVADEGAAISCYSVNHGAGRVLGRKRAIRELDQASIDKSFEDADILTNCRQYPKDLYRDVSDLIIGTKGRSNGMDMGTKGINPYVQEHIDMIKSITGEGPYINQGMRVAESTMTAIMGRESAYSGLKITWEMIMASKQDLQPKEFDYKQTMEPIPLPVPGVYKFV
jgi:hypothetical protein